MRIEQGTEETYSPAQIIAFALWEMTFHGFTEAENRAVQEELQRPVAELDAMTNEERKARLIPAEQVFAELEAQYGESGTESDDCISADMDDGSLRDKLVLTLTSRATSTATMCLSHRVWISRLGNETYCFRIVFTTTLPNLTALVIN